MKNLFLLILLISISLAANSQQYGWKDISTNIGTEANLSDVFFVSDDEGWIVSSISEKIYHTTDGGETFVQQEVPLEGDLMAIQMLDNLHGYCGNSGGWIFKTEDGGENWNILGSMGTLTDISFPPNTNPDNPIGYACGDAGNVWRITDELSNLNTGLTGTFRGISAPSTNNAWVCGGNRIYYYNGIDFLTQPGPIGTFNDIQFINDNKGWVVGDAGVIGNTIDGGDYWHSPINPDPNKRTLIKVFFLGSGEGWTVGADGVILHTTDGGINWVIEGEGLADIPLRSVYFTSPINGYIVGNNGTLLKYTNVSGLGEMQHQLAFSVYPNPCRDELTLRSSILDLRSSILQVIDMTGRIMHQEEYRGDGVMEFSADVSHLPAGLYLVKLQTEAGVGVRKIIKQ